MNAGQLILIVMCAWVAVITTAYLRECVRRKRLLRNLDRLLAKWTYMVRVAAYADVSMFYQVASDELEKTINEEK